MEYLVTRECQREPIVADWFTPELLPPSYRQYLALEIDPMSRKWVMETGAYVGILPLAADYGIQILPKSGLKNLTYMLYKSGLLNRSLETPFDQTVPYQIPDDDLESFFEGLVQSFLGSLDIIRRWGLARETVAECQSAVSIRGKIDYLRWTRSIPRTAGFPVPQIVFTSTLDNLANRILRRCLEYLARTPLHYFQRTDVLARLDYFGQVPSSWISAEEVVEAQRLLERGQFQSSRYYYLPALNLALLILRGAGLALGDDQDVTFKPILIDTASMFEKYIRVISQEALQELDAHVEDGRQFPEPFYRESSRPISVEPDILVRRGGQTLLVADVKYKFAPTAQDHYQLWAYMQVHQVERAGFVSVSESGAKSTQNPQWFRREQRHVFDYAFDCRHIKQSEETFKQMLVTQVRAAAG